MRMRGKDIYTISGHCDMLNVGKKITYEEDPGVAVYSEGLLRSTRSRKHLEKCLRIEGVLLMTSVSSIGHSRDICVAQEGQKIGPVRYVQCPVGRKI